MRPPSSRSLKSIVLCAAAFSVLGSVRCLAQTTVKGTAWQNDEQLGEKWSEMTGRFIFQRICLDCHTGGPGEYTGQQWQELLVDFPANSHPELPPTYNDLTAMFAARRMVPNGEGRRQALETFLLKNAPAKTAEPGDEIDLFPKAGDKAPDFTIQDVHVEPFALESLKGKRNLVLVFSRADW